MGILLLTLQTAKKNAKKNECEEVGEGSEKDERKAGARVSGMAVGLIFSTLAVAVGALSLLGGLTTHSGVRIGFSEDACENVREALEQRIVGQTLATRQVRVDICFSYEEFYNR